ncbi:MAG: ThiF family adenylyltransferase, partial [Deltaproteobacteria bacterium]
MSAAHRIIVVGAGGLGSPLLRLLAVAGGSGVEHITIIDDDLVEESNLHRQTLYSSDDVGRSKIERAAGMLRDLSPGLSVRTVEGRFVPDTAMELLSDHTLVVEGADNLATKFLVADAAHL